jgi:hypothetical protein
MGRRTNVHPATARCLAAKAAYARARARLEDAEAKAEAALDALNAAIVECQRAGAPAVARDDDECPGCGALPGEACRPDCPDLAEAKAKTRKRKEA